MPILTMIVISIVIAAVSLVVGELIKPKPDLENARAADSGDFRITTATEGRKVPLIWGTVLMDGPNIVWWGNISTRRIREKIPTGLFTKDKKITVGFEYFLSFQFALCRGVIDGVRKIRYNTKHIIYDGALTTADITFDDKKLFGGRKKPNSSGGLQLRFVIHDGAQIAVDPHLSAILTADLLPTYEGTAFLVMKNLDVASDLGAYIGNQPNLSMFDFIISRYPNNLGLTASNHIVNTLDANPAEVIYEILTDTSWGMGIQPTDIDLSNFQTIGDTLFDEGNGFSFRLDQSKEPLDIIREVERQIAGQLFIDLFTGKFNIKLIRPDYTLGALDLYDESNIVEIKSFARSSWNGTVNEVRVPFDDATKDYKSTSALAQDGANFEIQGERKIATVRFPGVKDRDLAGNIAWRELRTLSYPLATISFICNRQAFNLKPADVIRFSWVEFGIVDMPLRISRLDFGTLSDGKITIDAVQDIFVSEVSAFAAAPDSEFFAPLQEAAPFVAADQFISELPLLFAKQEEEGETLKFHALVAGAENGSFPYKYEMLFGNNPSPTYTSLGDSEDGVAVAGTLRASLVGFTSAMPAQEVGTIDVDPRSGLTDLLAELAIGDLPADEINAVLLGVAVIDPGTSDEEYIIYQEAVVDAGGIELRQVIRGAMDTVPKTHSIDAPIWFASEGGFSILPKRFSANNDRSVKLLPATPTDAVTELEQVADLDIVFPGSNLYRAGKPYAPNELTINGSTRPASASADFDISEGSEPVTPGFNFIWTRRDRNGDKVRENALGLDDVSNADWDNDEGANDNLRWNIWLYDLETTPSPTGRGQAILALSSDIGALITGIKVTRAQILAATVGNIIPNSMRVEIESEHNFPLTDNVAFEVLEFDFSVTSDLQTADTLGAVPYNTLRPTGTTDIDVSGLSGTTTITLQRHVDTQGDAHTQVSEVEVELDGVVTPITGLSPAVNVRPGITGTVSVTGVDQLQIRHAHGRGDNIFFEITNGGNIIAQGELAPQTTQVGSQGQPTDTAHDFGWIEYDATDILKDVLVLAGAPLANAWTVPRDLQNCRIHAPGISHTIADARATSESVGVELGIYFRIDRADGGTQVYKLAIYSGNDNILLPEFDIVNASSTIDRLKAGDIISLAANVARAAGSSASNPIQLYFEDEDESEILASGQFSIGNQRDYSSFSTSATDVLANIGTTGPPTTGAHGTALDVATGQRLDQRFVARIDTTLTGRELWLYLNSAWVELTTMPGGNNEFALRASDTDIIRVWHNWSDGLPRNTTRTTEEVTLSLYDWAIEKNGTGNGDRAKIHEVPLVRTDGSADFVQDGASGTLVFSTDTPGVNSSESIELASLRHFNCGVTLATLLPSTPTVISFGGWVKHLGTPTKDGFFGAADGSAWNEGFGFDMEDASNIRAWVGDWTATEVSNSGLIRRAITASAWNHVVYTCDLANDRATLYINGSQAGAQITDFTAISNITGLSSLIQLGRVGDFNANFNMRYDEFFIYDVELTSGNVTTIYNAGNPLDLTGTGAPSGLVAYWQIEDTPDTINLLTDTA